MSRVVSVLMQGQPARWHVVLKYRADAGVVDVHHDIEELEALAGIVERGPNWNALIDCVVTPNRVTMPGLTIEQAEQL